MVARHRDNIERTFEPAAVRAVRPAARRASRRRRQGADARLRLVEDALPMVRVDALPEHSDYVDTGCSVAPSCLRCPLARCIEDEPVRAAARRAAFDRRNREIAYIYRRYSVPAELLATTYGMTRRQVFRILSAAP